MDILNTTRDMEALFGGYELCRTQTSQIKQLREKLEDSSITVAVIGQFKRGKTTLVNEILGEELLPVGIVPITAAVTRITYGEPEVQVIFQNGLCETVEPSELSAYISEQENHDNALGVAEVELHVSSEFLRSGVVLVDTPGVGSAHEKNSRAAYDFVRESDAVIFMLSVDSPINQIEIDFLKRVGKYAGKFYFLVNKVDLIDEKELSEYMDYCHGLLSKLTGSREIRLLAVSAKKGRGVEELKRAISEDIREESREIMTESVRRKLLELLNNTTSQIRSYRTVLNMAPNVFHSRFREIQGMLEDLRKQKEEIDPQETFPVTELNEEKHYLQGKVRELFEIDYYYDIHRVDREETLDAVAYAERAEALYTELEQTLNAIFMYKEENTYAVARRIEDLNILIREMGKLKKQLE
ncbi:MAG: dynamin family protein, partial [Bacillota bacterium]|nr:dynamin family protein [Bacillota bacterium]